MVRVLMNVPRIWWAGGQINAEAIMRHLPNDEFKFLITYIHATDDALEHIEQFGETRQLPPVPNESKSNEHIDAVKEVIRDWEPDVVQSNSWQATLAAKDLGVPSVTKAGSIEGIKHHGSDYADVTYRVSPAVPGDAPVNLFGVDPVEWAEEREEGLIIWLGRIAPDRKPLLFMDALKVLNENTDIEFGAKMIGGISWDYIDVEYELKKRGLNGIVDYLGRLPHPEAVTKMAEGDVICSPFPEGSGTGVAEALTAGLIPIVPNDYYGPALSDDGNLGVMTTPDADAVAEALEFALTDEELRGKREEISERARRIWDNRRTAATYGRAYRNLAGKRKPMNAELGVTHNDDLIQRGQVWDAPAFGDGDKTVAEHVSDRSLSTPEARMREWQGVGWFPAERGETILDVGCGNASYARLFTEKYELFYAGVDNSEEMLRLALERDPGLELYHGRLPLDREDEVCLPFEDEAFDIVFCTAVLHHLPETQPAVEELWRVAKRVVVAHHRVVMEGEGVDKKGSHGEILRFPPQDDVDAGMRVIDPSCEMHVVEIEGINTRYDRLGDLYYVLRKKE